MSRMTEAQWRAWVKTKLNAFAARVHYSDGKRYRHKSPWLQQDLEKIVIESELRRPTGV